MALSEKGINKVKEYIQELGPRGASLKLINILLNRMGLSVDDLPDSIELMNGLDEMESLMNNKQYNDALSVAKETGRNMLEDEGFPGMREGKINKKILKTNKMKRVTFKKIEFATVEEALSKIPNVLKEDMNVFEMTDGNKTIKVRWEGSLNEGVGVAITGKDEKLISEDMKHIQHLMGYKSEDTLGTVKGAKRIDENETFRTLMGKVSKDEKKKD